MHAAVERYARHRRESDQWALGRFVVPASRLEELAAARGNDPDTWRLSVLLGDDAGADIAAATASARASMGRVIADSAEIRVARGDAPDRMTRLHAIVPHDVQLFIEIEPAEGLDDRLRAIAAAGAHAKIRTGGITAEMFPSPANVVAFLRGCLRHGLSFKATAGLHHPVRSRFRLTYQPDAPLATMYGFLNLFVAAAFLHAGADDDRVLAILTSEEPHAFSFTDSAARWADAELSLHQIVSARERFALSFGSCSFEEPMRELRDLALL